MLGTIRLLLALGVVASHTKGYRFDLYQDTGIIAVCAFFILSGYLMPATLEKNYAGHALPYLKNRFLRVFPVYWLAIAAALVILPRLPEWRDAYDFGLEPVMQNIALLGLNQWPSETLYIGPAWTLDVELQYYLLVPLLVMIPVRPRVALIVALAAASLYLQFNPVGLRAIDRSFFSWSAYFFAGMALYMVAPAAKFFRSKTRLDRELGDVAYPLFILHPIVIQAAGLRLDFWPLMAANVVMSLAVAYLVHRLVSPTLSGLRSKTRSPELRPAE